MVLHEPVRPRDDHRADGVGALDVRVVVDLDPLRRCLQPEGFAQTGQQFGLRRAFRHPAGQRLPRVAQGARDKFRLLAALGHEDLDLAPGLLAQRLGHQVGVLDGIRQDHLTRRLLVVVELAEEGLQHFCRRNLGAGAGIVIAVAPVLVGADEEDLHAGLPALHVERHDIGLGHAARVDALRALHLGQRADPVAQRRRALELHRLRGRLHLGRELFLHLCRAAREEAFGIGDRGGIAGAVDMADAGPRTPLDLVEQAGPRPAVEHRVRAVAQKERLLKLVQRPVHGARTGEGPEIDALLGLGATVLLDLRKGVILGDEDVGETFVVAQKHVVLGLELLDQVLFEQQRLGLGPGGEEHHRGGVPDHPVDPSRMPPRPGIVRHPRLQVPRLADVEHPRLRIEHPVDAGRAVERLQVALDAGIAGGRHGGFGRGVGHRTRDMILRPWLQS